MFGVEGGCRPVSMFGVLLRGGGGAGEGGRVYRPVSLFGVELRGGGGGGGCIGRYRCLECCNDCGQRVNVFCRAVFACADRSELTLYS